MTTHTSTPPALSKQPSNYPKLSFNKTMQLYVKAGGVIQAVGACSARDFEEFIQQALTTYRQSRRASEECLNACLIELAGIEYDELGKWFAVLTLQEYRIKAPVFLTREDAYASEHQEMVI